MHTLLVTGGAGFIGSCFVRMVVGERRARVVNLDKLTYAGCLESLTPIQDDPLHTFIRGDIADGILLAELFKEHRPSGVVHFAAESHVDRSIDGPRAFVQTNVVGTFELLAAARTYLEGLPIPERDAFRFLNISTDEVYGSLGPEGRFTEWTAYAPNSPYAASKASSDHLARAFHRTFGLPVIVTHSSNNYGPCQFPEKLIPLTILNALSGRRLPVYGDGGYTRDWLHVEDHCRALMMVLEKGRPGTVYNVGGDAERTNLEVVRAVCRAVDRALPDLPHAPCSSLIDFVEDRPGHDRRYAVDSTKIRVEIGWAPRMPFKEGLEQTVAWYLAHPEWVVKARQKYPGDRLGQLQGGDSQA